jgi:hypothetical protein
VIKFWKFRIYYGTENWGWNRFGIGWDTLWFLGFSINAIKEKP